ncbi:hypothetical protein HYH03_008678 [Edaphochlamys debaryana]|uniref:BTB domain-containing protein n=1 Tax=Edaphochlamys debaryana TaxID=47281 RepID=A0A836BXY0_9CHLO|nr:hypothetical protein HYH03_008678 [Edaphochlamys debaryana]|eukprot:KAG2493015.1 hypothetical protein HYH03_008678 [Edaphochlamys debaryana]
MSAEQSSVAYGSEADADCVVRFVLSQNDSERPAKRARVNRDISGEPLADGTQDAEEDPPGANAQGNTTGDAQPIGDPLPGHRALLRQGSSFFQAQAGLWLEGKGTGDKPELRVPLGSPEDLPHALAAIRYMYTAKLQEGMSAAELLHVRRLASYLGVEGCVEACRTALAALAREGTAEDPLAGVVQLYTVRHLLPCWDDDPAGVAESVLNECRAQLVAYKPAASSSPSSNPSPPVNAGPAEPAEAPPPPPLASLLVWAFPDAPSVLSSPASRAHVSALPASSLEVLLGADDFATDSESSVLLLLAVWMAANRGAKIEERGRLTKLVRLCHLSSAYLYCVLPQLPETWSWLPPEELPLIQQCAALPSLEERKRFAAEVVPRMGVKALPAWYTSEPRPKARADAGRPYVWTTPVVEIDEALAAARLKAGNYNKLGAFTHGATVVIADGFELYCQLRVSSKTPKHVGCSLQNATPAVLALGQPVHNLMTPGKCLIGVWRGGPGGSSLKGYRCTFRATDWIQVGYARGYHEALAFTLPPPPPPRPAPPPSPSPSPTAASEGAAADGAAPGGAGTGGGAAAGAAAAPAGGVPSGSAATLLAPFVWEGKVWGYLTWSD